jgi:hypothetical protein
MPAQFIPVLLGPVPGFLGDLSHVLLGSGHPESLWS